MGILLYVVFSTVCIALSLAACGYESCDLGKEGMINVHLVPHTHDDVGWLKTVDQYYVSEVQYILDSVMVALEANPMRKFSYVEIAFFYRWWQQQSNDMQQKVKNFVNNGQLHFILGGWCMNDEASTHYNAIIDQHTEGVKFLRDNFGDCGRPRVAWQIDPFGHSREQANLFAQMGYDAVYFARIDYQDYIRRNDTRELEMIWRGSDDYASDLFTGALYGQRYGAPDGFAFDIYDDNNIQDDRRLHDYDVDDFVKKAINFAVMQNMSFKGNHIAWLMGDDFNYQNAANWYKNMDKLISLVNARQAQGSKVNMLYSTPACYTYAKNKANVTWPTKNDDFFPYAHRPHAYWTGYFTSRAAFKGMVRKTNNFLQVAKQLDALAKIGPDQGSDTKLDVLKQAMGVAQHHDAVSGTAKQVVTYDYAQRLSDGIDQSMDVVNVAYQRLLNASSRGFPLPLLEYCPLTNISRCNATETSKSFTVLVYNPDGRPVDAVVQLPVLSNSVSVADPQGKSAVTQVTPISKRTQMIPEAKGGLAAYDLWFKASVPPLGFSTYFVTYGTGHHESAVIRPKRFQDVIIENQYLQVTFDGATGLMKQIINKESQIKTNINQQIFYYIGMRGNNSAANFTASGAYLFRPNGTQAFPLNPGTDNLLVKGDLIQEYRQSFGDWATQVIRLGRDDRHLEVEWTVGPIPLGDGVGREIISRYDTDLHSEGVFYTDSNGRQMLQRQKDYRSTWSLDVNEPVAGNYYPVNSRIYIQDLKQFNQLTVLTDRSQGGSSLHNGSIELMLHRVTMDDDSLGVGEPLQEKGADGNGLIVRGKHLLIFDTIARSAQLHRDLAEKMFMAPLVTVSRTDQASMAKWSKTLPLQGTFIGESLPDNVHLLTLEALGKNQLLLRLEHFYGSSEDPVLSKNATVSLQSLFPQFTIISVTELTLEANQNLDASHRLSWNSKSFNSRGRKIGDGFTVELSPMMIRTFELSIA